MVIFGIVNFSLALIFFFILRRITKAEREKMLSLKILQIHSQQYTKEYNDKIKAVLGGEMRQNPNAIDNSDYQPNMDKINVEEEKKEEENKEL